MLYGSKFLEVLAGLGTDYISSFFVFITAALAVWAYRPRLPPGPWGLPFFGYLPFMRSDAHVHFAELAKKYGPIFSLKLGSQFIVVLSDYRLIREAFRREEFTGRPITEFHNLLQGYGIVNSVGRLWKSQRKFLHDKLRKLGMTYTGTGKEQMEAKIMTEVLSFLKTLTETSDKPIDLNPALSMSTSNIICSVVMSKRFTISDPKFNRFMDLFAEGFRLFGAISYANFIPIMKYLPSLKDNIERIGQNRSEMAEFFQETVDNHRNSLDLTNPRDIVDNYLVEINEAKETGSEKDLYDGKDHDRQIQQIIGDLFSAGMETIKTTLQWAVVYMLREPEAAKSVREELDTIIGRGRLPRLEDRPFLPRTEATILEVLRISSIVPLGTTHAVTRDVVIGDYLIPENAHVVPLLHSVHMDPNLWDSPEKFKPERFLNAEGKVVKPDYFLPFGVGRRMCLGDVLARMELFEFFSSLMHTFDLQLPNNCQLPSLKAIYGVTLTPQDFKVILKQRYLENSPYFFLNASSDTCQGLRTVGSN